MSLDHIWGVDTGTQATAIGVVALTKQRAAAVAPMLIAHRTRPEQAMSRRMAAVAQAVRIALAIQDEELAPTLVVLETPIGLHPAPAANAAWGVVAMCLGESLDCPILDLRPSQWKAAAGLSGSASKEQIRAAADDLLPRAAGTQDEADATMMAMAGAALLRKRNERS